MSPAEFPYVIVGGGLAAASAVEGIREHDKTSPILLISAEKDLPYNRPPLSKGLWTGKEKPNEIFIHDGQWYDDQHVTLRLGAAVTQIDPKTRQVTDASGATATYGTLLLATGGTPNHLQIPGGDLPDLIYFRTADDYRRAVAQAAPGKKAVVIGGSFIGSEMAAALRIAGLDVTMLFPGSYLCQHVFPESLGHAVNKLYQEKGVKLVSGDRPTSIQKENGVFHIQTRNGQHLTADLVVAGIGIQPNVAMARAAGLKVSDGIEVNDRLQSSDQNIYAAGDIACFPDPILGRRRMEHWDNAQAQGKRAGENMAGASLPFDYMPLFFSDLFELGYEAVGLVRTSLETVCDWQEENKTGVVYYLQNKKVRGVLLCNVWEKVDAARALIKAGQPADSASLRGAIK